jgi:hypothetical protein
MVGIKEELGRAEVDMVRVRVRVRVFARFMTKGDEIQGNVYLDRSDSSWVNGVASWNVEQGYVSSFPNFLLGRPRSTPDEMRKSSEIAENAITDRVAHRSLTHTLER